MSNAALRRFILKSGFIGRDLLEQFADEEGFINQTFLDENGYIKEEFLDEQGYIKEGDQIYEELIKVEDLEDGLVLGSDSSGVIIHNSPGETLEGGNVEEENWVEIYGEEIHFNSSQ